MAVTNNTTNFPNAAGGSKQNGTAVTFPTATGSWGAVVAFALFDASTSGNMLHWGAISPTKTINNGDVFTFPVGGIVNTED